MYPIVACALFVKPISSIKHQRSAGVTSARNNNQALPRHDSTAPRFFSIVSFALSRAFPAIPWTSCWEPHNRDISHRHKSVKCAASWGLDKPATQQYLSWISGVLLRGQLGRSYETGGPHRSKSPSAFLPRCLLVGTSLIFAFTFGITCGLLMAAINGTRSDQRWKT